MLSSLFFEIDIKNQTLIKNPPKLNNLNIFSGSPADKAELEVADEILEINGKTLQNCSHAEVINHIHNVSFRNKKKSYFYCFLLISFKVSLKNTHI